MSISGKWYVEFHVIPPHSRCTTRTSMDQCIEYSESMIVRSRVHTEAATDFVAVGLVLNTSSECLEK